MIYSANQIKKTLLSEREPFIRYSPSYITDGKVMFKGYGSIKELFKKEEFEKLRTGTMTDMQMQVVIPSDNKKRIQAVNTDIVLRVANVEIIVYDVPSENELAFFDYTRLKKAKTSIPDELQVVRLNGYYCIVEDLFLMIGNKISKEFKERFVSLTKRSNKDWL